MSLLKIEDLHVTFGADGDRLAAVQSLDLQLAEGETLGIVGESGSGKSVAMLALMGLIDTPAMVRARRLEFAGTDLLRASSLERRRMVGKDLAVVFQDPMASLNPVYRVGHQMVETLRAHESASGRALKSRALALLESVGIADPQARFDAYPHQLSGGMCQRVMIAMAVACRPRLLIADEPTTALDVTVQAQIMDLLQDLQARHGMAVILISHNLAVVARFAARVLVMYAGELVEQAPARMLFESPRHPYTQALVAAIPENTPVGLPIPGLAGVVPARRDRGADACLLAARCVHVEPTCLLRRPSLAPIAGDWMVRCVKAGGAQEGASG